MSNEIKGNEIPTGLSRIGRKAAQTIVKKLEKEGMSCTGGCRTFYTPKEWKERGEYYGLNSELIVVYDGGEVGPFFGLDYECYALHEEMRKTLKEIGVFAEEQTCWYSAIYKL